MSAPRFKTLTLKVAPTRGVAPLAASIDLPGYTLRKMVRTGTRAVITFERVPRVAPKK